MSNVAEFPDKECFFVGRDIDEATGKEVHLLEYFKDGIRTRIGEYPTMMEMIITMDKMMDIDRSEGAA